MLFQVALYARQTLNIRSVSNYLIAFACDQVDCRPYVRAYFNKVIRTPSDMLEVTDVYARQVLYKHMITFINNKINTCN